MRSSLEEVIGMAEERTPEEEERFRRLAERLLKEEKPKGARVKKSPIAIFKKSAVVIPLIAILGAFSSLMTCWGGFQLNDITMENFTISTGAITMSGQLTLQKVDNQDIWIQEASEMRIENLCLRKVEAEGVLEIKATEATGTGAYLEIAAPLPIAENMVGETLDLGLLLQYTTKIEGLQVIRMHVETQTLYGMEINIS